MRPVRAKALLIALYLKAFALTGRQVCVHNYPGRCPGLGASALSGRVGHTGRVELTCENSITEISYRFRLISEKKTKN